MGLGKFLSGLFSGDSGNSGDVRPAAEAETARAAETRSGDNSPGEELNAGGAELHAEGSPPASVSLEDVSSAEPPAEPAPLTEEKILETLSNVYDPEIPIDIVNLGLIYGIDIDGGNVHIAMTMTAPGCPASTQIAGESRLLVEEIPGVESVDIEIVWDPPWDPSRMSEEAQQSLNF